MKTILTKTAAASLLLGALLTSCAGTYEAIGKVNILSETEVASGLKYTQLTTNSGADKKELKYSTAATVQEAVAQVIGNVPGGRFITDVTIYAVNDGYFAVTGNVWGTTNDSIPAKALNYVVYTQSTSPSNAIPLSTNFK
jgi:hypothetical protein